VRPAVGRAHRGDPDVDAADREVALRLAARAGHKRGAAVQRLPAAARLGRLDAGLRRIGILGGSFDPPHNAHLALAHVALQPLALDELRWLPAGQPWQKTRELASAADREAMVALTIAG